MVSQLQFGRGSKLWTYWTKGNGLGRWLGSPTPYRTLRAELLSEGVPAHMADGLAANIYHAVLGRWPGKHDGGDHGSTAGDKVAAKG
jgi:hypothetical protein